MIQIKLFLNTTSVKHQIWWKIRRHLKPSNLSQKPANLDQDWEFIWLVGLKKRPTELKDAKVLIRKYAYDHFCNAGQIFINRL